MRPYRPDHYAIVQSRNHYAIYGVQSNPHYHARLTASPLFVSETDAIRWLGAHINAFGVYRIAQVTNANGNTVREVVTHPAVIIQEYPHDSSTAVMSNGHFAGATGVRCSYGCSERMRDDNNDTFHELFKVRGCHAGSPAIVSALPSVPTVRPPCEDCECDAVRHWHGRRF